MSWLLADTRALYLKIHNYHWNVVRPMFNTLHLIFEEQYNELAPTKDLVAECLRPLGEPVLRYDNRVEADGRWTTVRLTARLEGPAARFLERLVTPVSALGQRRRIARLVELAELIDRRSPS